MKRRFRIILATMTVVLVGLAAAVAPTDSPTAGADHWAAGLTQSDAARWSQPSETVKLPFEYRKALISRQSSATKVSFWAHALDSVEAAAGVLNDAQVRSMLETRALVAQFFDEAGAPSGIGTRLAEVRNRFATAFGADAARIAFLTGSGDSTGGNLPVVERVLWTWRTAKPSLFSEVANTVAPTLAAAACNCNEAADDCYYEQHCRSPFSCEYSAWGCGSWWTEECNKRCSYDAA